MLRVSRHGGAISILICVRISSVSTVDIRSDNYCSALRRLPLEEHGSQGAGQEHLAGYRDVGEGQAFFAKDGLNRNREAWAHAHVAVEHIHNSRVEWESQIKGLIHRVHAL
jgi:hypothetical protein